MNQIEKKSKSNNKKTPYPIKMEEGKKSSEESTKQELHHPEKETSKSTSGKTTPKKKIFLVLLGIIFTLVIVVILGIIIFGIGIYKYNWQGKMVDKITTFLPYPAALVGGKMVRYSDYLAESDALNYYLSQPQNEEIAAGLKGDTAKKTIINKLIRQIFVYKRAGEYKIQVSDEEIKIEFEKIVGQAPGGLEDLTKSIKDSFKWNVDDFKEKALKPYLYAFKLQKKIAADDQINSEAKKRAEDVSALIKKGEEDFESLAKKYSEDTSASSGGDIGYISKGETVPEFENAAFALKKDEVSVVVKTEFGYHIIKLVDKLQSPDGSEKLHIKHILIKSKSIDQWLVEELAKTKVWVFISGLKWQKKCSQVLLKSESCDDTTSSNANSNQAVNQNINSQ